MASSAARCPDFSARILPAVRVRPKLVLAAAFTISAALQFQNAELYADIILIEVRCVGDGALGDLEVASEWLPGPVRL